MTLTLGMRIAAWGLGVMAAGVAIGIPLVAVGFLVDLIRGK